MILLYKIDSNPKQQLKKLETIINMYAIKPTNPKIAANLNIFFFMIFIYFKC